MLHKVAKLRDGMTNVYIAGTVLNTSKPRHFVARDGRHGTVARATMNDGTGSVALVFWGVKAQLVDAGIVRAGNIISVFRGRAKMGQDGILEVHAGHGASVSLENRRSAKRLRSTRKWQDADGYLRYHHTNQLVHRWIVENKTRISIPVDHHVHHRNGNKRDNRPKNLQILPGRVHMAHHRRYRAKKNFYRIIKTWARLFR